MREECFNQPGNYKYCIETEEDAKKDAAHHHLPANERLAAIERAENAYAVNEKEQDACAEDDIAATHKRKSEAGQGRVDKRKHLSQTEEKQGDDGNAVGGADLKLTGFGRGLNIANSRRR